VDIEVVIDVSHVDRDGATSQQGFGLFEGQGSDLCQWWSMDGHGQRLTGRDHVKDLKPDTGGMPLLFVLLLAVPLAELYVIVKISGEIGFFNTIGLLILVSIIGAWLLKREGLATWKRLNEQLQTGKIPTKEVTDGAMIMFGGALLLTPGFLTDIVGISFVLPPTRAMLKGVFRKMAGGWALKRTPAGYAGYKVYDATVVRSRRRSNPSPKSSPHEEPRSLPGSDGGDSPGRG
jgi:UPF0716 protein FxsA